MDLGFGQLIEKFEEHVGKTPTKILLYVVFVAVFAVCMKAIIDNLVSPTMSFLDTPLFGSTLVKLGLMALSVGLGVGVGVQALAAFAEWKSLRKAKEVLRDAESMMDRIELESAARHDTNKELFGEIRSLSDRARDMMLASMTVTEQLASHPNVTAEHREMLELVLAGIRESLAGEREAAALNDDNARRLAALGGDGDPRKAERSKKSRRPSVS